jgi:hypothetical protein
MSFNLIGNPTFADATTFCISKFLNITGMPRFWNIRTYFLAANLACMVDFDPVTTMLPEAKAKAVVLGSIVLIVAAAKF